jgi:hypothetical protein
MRSYVRDKQGNPHFFLSWISIYSYSLDATNVLVLDRFESPITPTA